MSVSSVWGVLLSAILIKRLREEWYSTSPVAYRRKVTKKLKIASEYSTVCLLHSNRPSVQVSLLTFKSSDVGDLLHLMIFPSSPSAGYVHVLIRINISHLDVNAWRSKKLTMIEMMAGLVPLGFDLAVNKFPGLYDLLLRLVSSQVIRYFLVTVPVQWNSPVLIGALVEQQRHGGLLSLHRR